MKRILTFFIFLSLVIFGCAVDNESDIQEEDTTLNQEKLELSWKILSNKVKEEKIEIVWSEDGNLQLDTDQTIADAINGKKIIFKFKNKKDEDDFIAELKKNGIQGKDLVVKTDKKEITIKNGSMDVENNSVNTRSLNNFSMAWSYAGPISGMYCTQWYEASDPHTWADNYFCTSRDEGFQWSSAGPIPGMRCLQINEPSDPHTWNDNYLCWPSNNPLQLQWSYAGPISGKYCIQTNEPSDPYTWNDNYICKNDAWSITLSGNLTNDNTVYFGLTRYNYTATSTATGYLPTSIRATLYLYKDIYPEIIGPETGSLAYAVSVSTGDMWITWGFGYDTVKGHHEVWFPWGIGYLDVYTQL